MRWMLAFGLCWTLAAVAADGAGTLHRGNGPEPDSLDIHLAQGLSAHNILRDLYDGLTRAGSDGNVTPDAASSWSWSEDRLQLTLQLRPEARWSDGEPVVAMDFVRGWQTAVTPATGSPYAHLFSAIRNGAAIARGEAAPDSLGVAALGTHTLQVDLVRPAAELLHQFALPVTFPMPKAPVKPRVSNGRYQLVDWVPQSHVDLFRNPHHPNSGDTAIEKVRFHTIEDAGAELKRFRAGELHITETVPPGRVPWVKKNLPDALRIAPYYGSYWFGFNLTRAPFQGAPALRRALSLAIDRTVLAERVLGAGQKPAWGIVPRGADWPHSKSSDRARTSEIEQAKAAYREAGFGPGKPATIEISVNSGSQHRRLAVAIAAMWKQTLGVKTTIVRQEWKAFVQNRRSRTSTEVFRWGWIGDYADPLSFLELFESESPLNASGYSNPAYDEQIRLARVGAGQDRTAVLMVAEKMLLADNVTIPLYYYVSQHLVSPDILGWEDNQLDRHPTASLSFRAP